MMKNIIKTKKTLSLENWDTHTHNNNFYKLFGNIQIFATSDEIRLEYLKLHKKYIRFLKESSPEEEYFLIEQINLLKRLHSFFLDKESKKKYDEYLFQKIEKEKYDFEKEFNVTKHIKKIYELYNFSKFTKSETKNSLKTKYSKDELAKIIVKERKTRKDITNSLEKLINQLHGTIFTPVKSSVVDKELIKKITIVESEDLDFKNSSNIILVNDIISQGLKYFDEILFKSEVSVREQNYDWLLTSKNKSVIKDVELTLESSVEIDSIKIRSNETFASNKSNEETLNFDDKETLNFDDKETLNFDDEETLNFDDKETLNLDDEETLNFDDEETLNFDDEETLNFDDLPEENGLDISDIDLQKLSNKELKKILKKLK